MPILLIDVINCNYSVLLGSGAVEKLSFKHSYLLLSASSSGSFLAEGKRLACTTACSAMAFSEES